MATNVLGPHMGKETKTSPASVKKWELITTPWSTKDTDFNVPAL